MAAPREPEPDVLPLVDPVVRSRLGTVVCVLGLIAVVLAAAGAPAAVRAPFVLLAALTLPGFPLVARLKVDLPTLLAIDVCVSLALEAGLALVMVEARIWHPQALGLLLAAFGVGGTFLALTQVRHLEARHLR